MAPLTPSGGAEVTPWAEMARLVMKELEDGIAERARLRDELAEMKTRFAVLQARLAVYVSVASVVVGIAINIALKMVP